MKKKTLNVITLGDSFVGKTSIIQRIKDDKFNETVQGTIYLDHFCIQRKYEKKNLIINLLFKDTAGHERFQEVPLQYIRDSHIVLLVFCDIKTLNSIKDSWYKSYKEKANIKNSRFILIGNKSDTFGDDKKEIEKQGNKFAEEIDAQFLMCSTNSEDNKDNLDRYITTEAKRYIDNEEKNKNDDNIQKSEKITIGTHDNQNNRRRFRCAKC